ncbi:MAG: hypothetical protein GF307_00045 [candidate division Zixibacteria bacterium]|nr:hypothetical protein [candidate division Zixibacteria bacterium]
MDSDYTVESEDRLNIFIIAVISFVALLVQFYDVIIAPVLGSIGLIAAIGGMLCIIPIALIAVWRGLKGGIWASLAFSLAAVVHFIFAPKLEGGLTSTSAEIISFIVAGLVIGYLMEQGEEEYTDETAERELIPRSEHTEDLVRLANMVAREMKPPLSTLRNTLFDLKKGESADTINGSYDTLEREVERLNGVVADYLDFSAPKVTHTDRIKVPAVLKEVVEQVSKQAKRVGVRLSYDNNVDFEGYTLGDKDRLSRMFLNILINGLQASEGGGQVTVRCSHDNLKSEMIIEITDTGPGINDEIRERIFEPFYSTRKRGSGLGLSISKTIAEEHNGVLTAENATPNGAKFTIRLPATDKKVVEEI